MCMGPVREGLQAGDCRRRSTQQACADKTIQGSLAQMKAADPPRLAGVHELGCAERGGLVGSHHPAAAAVHQGLVEFLRQDLGRACSPPHIALCGSAADRWLFACEGVQAGGCRWGGVRAGERRTVE